MGWSSASEYIEIVHDNLYDQDHAVSGDVIKKTLSELWKALEEGDWDVQDEFIEHVESFHEGMNRNLPLELRELFEEKGYVKIKDLRDNRYEWVPFDTLDQYNLKEYRRA